MTTGAGIQASLVGRYLLWVAAVVLLHGVARVLRGKGTFTQTFRVMGFVQTIELLGLLRLIEPIAPLVVVAVALLSAFAAWLGVAEAHRLRGWRTLALPVLYFIGLILAGAALANLLGGDGFGLGTLAQRFGIIP